MTTGTCLPDTCHKRDITGSFEIAVARKYCQAHGIPAIKCKNAAMSLQCDFGLRPSVMWTVVGCVLGAMALGLVALCICCGANGACPGGGRYGRRGFATKGSLLVELELLR